MKYQARRRNHYLWEVVGEGVSVVYSGITEEEAKRAAAVMNTLPVSTPGQAKMVRDLLHRMREYASHADGCAFLGRGPDTVWVDCDCGFDAVLDEYDRWAAT